MPANGPVTGVGVVTAMAAEARFLGAQVSRRRARAALPDASLVQVSGVGPEAAARAARELVAAGVSALASCGMAGGLDPALRSGTVLLPTEIMARDGTALPTSREWHGRVAGALAALGPLACGKLLTSARAIDTIAAKAQAFRETGAAGVDMESLAVAQVAAAHGLPFLAVRVIIDGALDAVPRSVMAAMRPSGEVQVGRLLAALVFAPGDVIALLRLARRYRVAGRALTELGRTRCLSAGAFRAVAAVHAT